jgi:hypothetical protein
VIDCKAAIFGCPSFASDQNPSFQLPDTPRRFCKAPERDREIEEEENTGMGDSRIAEELVQLLRGVSASLILKLSHFISLLSRYNNSNASSSVGAAAAAAATATGVTLALLFCTWRYWRMPRRISSSNRRRRNRSNRGPSNQSNKKEEEEGSPSSSSSSSLSSLEMEGSSTAVARAMTHATKRGSNSTSAEGGLELEEEEE